MVLLMGDFFQFPPVHGLPLWKVPASSNEAQKEGWALWRRFTDVVILDEQMRQDNGPDFRDLLRRARSGALTDRDVEILNSKVISDLSQAALEDSNIVVRSNNLRPPCQPLTAGELCAKQKSKDHDLSRAPLSHQVKGYIGERFTTGRTTGNSR